MDWLNQIANLISDNKIPLGKWAEAVVTWITDNLDWFFNGISDGLNFVMENTTAGLTATPAVLLIAIICAIAYALHRKWTLVLGVALGLLLILNLGFWAATIETLVLMVTGGTIGGPRPWAYPGAMNV